jgi:hypothetical protein
LANLAARKINLFNNQHNDVSGNEADSRRNGRWRNLDEIAVFYGEKESELDEEIVKLGWGFNGSRDWRSWGGIWRTWRGKIGGRLRLGWWKDGFEASRQWSSLTEVLMGVFIVDLADEMLLLYII